MDKDLDLDLNSIFYILVGSTFGLGLRFFIENKFKIKTGFYINNTSLVNFIASLLLGMLVAFKPMINNLLLLFYVSFLGCFSTFSSFIYQLFFLFQSRKLVRLFLHYIEVLIISFLFFYIGYYLVKIF